jgi:hypothetical protein
MIMIVIPVGRNKFIIIGLFFCFFQLVPTLNVAFASEGNWVEKGRLTGFAPKFGESPLFTIESKDWRIRWEYEPNVDYPNLTAFSIHVLTHPEVEDEPHNLPPSFREPIEEESYSLTVGSVIKSGIEQTSGIIYINDINGTFVMDIVSNADSYIIIIEENLDSIPEFPSWIILPLFLMATLSAIIVKKRLHPR